MRSAIRQWQTVAMPALDGPFIVGPVIALVVTGVLALLLRRAQNRQDRPVYSPVPGRPDDYGLLVPVATCRDKVDAELVREHLATAGIRSTLTAAPDSRVKVLVFADALDKARRLVG
jgi:hypothetical protein